MSGESSDQVRDGEKPRLKIIIKWKREAVTSINKGKEVAVEESFDDYHETTRNSITCSSSIFTCDICFKTFPSAKSLHGHMRSHPNRPYRGMIPPKKSSRPIRICSDDQDGRSSKLTSEAKRRRTCCSSVKGVEVEDEEDLFMGAVHGLMLLSTGDDFYKTLPTATSKKDGIRVSEVNMNIGTGCCTSSVEKKRKRENDEAIKCYDSSPKVSMEYWRGVLSLDSSNHVGFAKEDKSSSVAGGIKDAGLHICKECNKAFSSGRALGGHMRCHFKPLPVADAVGGVDQNLIAEDFAEDQALVADVVAADQTPIAEDQALVADVIAANVVAEDEAPIVRSFDLNEIPADV